MKLFEAAPNTIGAWLAEHGSIITFQDDIPDQTERERYVLDTTRAIFNRTGKFIRTLILRTGNHPKITKLMTITLDLPYELADEVPYVIQAMATSVQAKQLHLCMEAWYSVLRGEDHEAVQRGEAPKQQPRHDPDRKEALCVTSENAFRVPVSRSWKAEITRDAKGKPTLHPWEDFPMQSGRMVHLLPPSAFIKPGERMPTT